MDGSIQTVTPTKEGVGPVAPLTREQEALQELRRAWRKEAFVGHKAVLQGHLHAWRHQHGARGAAGGGEHMEHAGIEHAVNL